LRIAMSDHSAGECSDTDECECGHVRDEHDRECLVEDCPCVCFDLKPEGDDDAE
jgi:hypothetical protein